MPGWTAELNGHAERVRRANRVFQAVDVPAGRSNVLFSFAPPGAAVAVLACAIGFLLLIPWGLMYTTARPLRAERLEDSVPVRSS